MRSHFPIALTFVAACSSGILAGEPDLQTTGGADAGGPTFSYRAGDASPQASTELSADGKNCGVTTHALVRLPPQILLVLDRSGSMVENRADGPVCQTRACGTRWAEVTAALEVALRKTEAGIQWGLKVYPDDDFCRVDDGPSVPIAAHNAAAIIARYGARPPIAEKGYTPTREAVQKGSAYLRTLPGAHPKYLLLATDGEPNCAVSGRSNKDTGAAILAVADAAAAGTPVYVVGMSTSKTSTAATLNEMAAKGGRPRSDPTTKYYAVDSSEELVAAMNTIGAQVTSCTFALSSAPPVPTNVAVTADGARIPRDTAHADGWDYGPNMTSIQFHGAPCEKMQNGTIKSVQMIFGCPGAVIE